MIYFVPLIKDFRRLKNLKLCLLKQNLRFNKHFVFNISIGFLFSEFFLKYNQSKLYSNFNLTNEALQKYKISNSEIYNNSPTQSISETQMVLNYIIQLENELKTLSLVYLFSESLLDNRHTQNVNIESDTNNFDFVNTLNQTKNTFENTFSPLNKWVLVA